MEMLTKGQKLVYGFGGWMLLALTLLTLLNSLSLEYFFIVSFIGLLIIVELSGPTTIKPKWRTRMDYVFIVCILIFIIIVGQRVVNILHAYLRI